MSNDNVFTQLASVNVKDKVEQKGRFNYLSWAFAVSELLKVKSEATWHVFEWNDLPYMQNSKGHTFVKTSVTVEGITRPQTHPVLDGKNKPILFPDGFQINTSIQRCLTKNIALFGLGLSLYTGEDLTGLGDDAKKDDKTPPHTPDVAPHGTKPTSFDDYILQIEISESMEQLETAFTKAWNNTEGEERAKIVLAKDKKKQQLK